MIDLTPLDVRKKKGDFRRTMRGYDPDSVDNFLDEVVARMEELVRENSTLNARVTGMSDAIAEYREREKAMNEALVSAQQLREDMREQAQREADLALREARAEGERIIADAKRQVTLALEALRRVHAQRVRFLRLFRALVERQLTEIEQEEERTSALARLDAEVDRTDGALEEGGS
ncbi:MAG TPA: DivIVA domain-containing protein [Longimicrobium sp.]|nr:DivIVA domain-containing protein [Longimicrobium sp.]